jgi:predicted GNAT family acetyltransferase
LHFTGHTEVSAVCTHPNHLGRGYAGALVAKVVSRIRQRGEVAILHVRADNARAIGVYERLGFKPRLEYHVVVMERK